MDLISKVKVSDTSYEIKDGTARLAIVTLNNELNGKANNADLATVATSGSYNDLEDTPDLSELIARITALENQMIPHFQLATINASGNGETLNIVIIDNTSSGWNLTAPSGVTLSTLSGSGRATITATVAASATLETHTFIVQMSSAGEVVSTLTIEQAVPEIIITASLSNGTLTFTPSFSGSTSGSAALEASMSGTTLQITSGGESTIDFDGTDINIT